MIQSASSSFVTARGVIRHLLFTPIFNWRFEKLVMHGIAEYVECIWSIFNSAL